MTLILKNAILAKAGAQLFIIIFFVKQYILPSRLILKNYFGMITTVILPVRSSAKPRFFEVLILLIREGKRDTIEDSSLRSHRTVSKVRAAYG